MPEPAAAARGFAVYQPFYDRLGALCADYTSDGTAVIAGFFERAAAQVLAHCAQVRAGELDAPESLPPLVPWAVDHLLFFFSPASKGPA